jgi:betaine-aldehyde dehydrogenase
VTIDSTQPASARPNADSQQNGDVIRARLVIGGDEVDAADNQRFDVINPANGRTIATAPLGGKQDVERAVAAGRRAFDDPGGWATWPAAKRGRALARLANLIRDHSEELARLESRNVGKPISGARDEVIGASFVYDYYAGAANKLFGETIPVSKPGLDFTLREAIGVVGLIIPWNFPFLMASWKVGPALAAGNAAVLKPASYSPLTALRLGQLALEAGIPAGVLNVVTGPGGSAGASIAAHPGVGKVAFTGETTTGQEIMRLAAGNVKKISLELGGKSPNIVFADADIEKWAASAPYAVFDNCGQDCCARSRIFVERSIHDQAVELLTAATRKLKVGDPEADETEVGPLVSQKQRERVLDYIAIGRGEGAEIVIGGEPPSDPDLADGSYVMPTVFDGVRNEMRIATEEIFGPVVSVIAFDGEDEAVRLANATPYGLSGSVWSRDIGKALRTARRLQAGVVSVNSNSSVHTEAPFGGYKMSGVGRELGMHALELYTELKNVFIDLG